MFALANASQSNTKGARDYESKVYAADAGIETLRRAAEEAERAGDPLVLADVLGTLGSALVHAVRGFDGEGAVVLHRAAVPHVAVLGRIPHTTRFSDLGRNPDNERTPGVCIAIDTGSCCCCCWLLLPQAARVAASPSGTNASAARLGVIVSPPRPPL